MGIKVCGPGCANCVKAEKIEHEALGVLSTPAMVIDGVIKCVGRAPIQKDILLWIK